MTQINLLPWREQKREQEKKWFTTMILTGITLAMVIVFLMNCYATHLIHHQISRNHLLQQEITTLDKQLREIKSLTQLSARLISRMSIIQGLQSTRTMIVHLLDELIKIVPLEIYLSRLERQNDLVSLWGYAKSNTDISLLMRNIDSNAWIQKPMLTEIITVKDKKQPANHEFKLSFILKPK